MSFRGLFSSRLRLAVDFVALAGVAIAIVLLTHGSSASLAPTPTADQVQAATRWVSNVKLPAGTAVNLSDTPCMVSVNVCITSDMPVRTLAAELKTALTSQGGILGAGQSDPHACSSIAPSCLLFVRYHSAGIGVAIHSLHGYGSARTVALLSVANGAPAASSADPLPSVASLRAVPSGVEVHPRCLTTAADGGCMLAKDTISERGSLISAVSRWSRQLGASGWLLLRSACTRSGSSRECTLDGTKSLSRQGARFILFGMTLNGGAADRLTGSLQLTAVG